MSTIYNGAGMFFSHSIEINPDARKYKLHIHDTYEVLCVASGNVSYLVEGHEYAVPRGSVMIMRPTESHTLVVRGKGTYERYVLNFRGDVLQEMGLNESFLNAFNKRALGEGNQYVAAELGGLDSVGLFRRMKDECGALDPRCVVLANLASLLCAISSAFLLKDKIHDRQIASDTGKQMLGFINERLCDGITLTDVSEYVHMSPSNVNRIFRKMTGTSVYDYILSKRLVMARDLIATGEKATSASRRCGFSDYSSFYRLYKKRMGVPPSTVGSAK